MSQDWSYVALADGLDNPVQAGLIQMAYAKEWNDLAWRESVVTKVTSSKYFDTLDKGNACTIPIQPIVKTRAYVEGAPPKTDYGLPSTQTIQIDQARDWDHGVGPITSQFTYVDLLTKFGDSARLDMTDEINKDFFSYLSGKANEKNRGATAGKYSGTINLGTSAAPVKVAPDNIVKHLLKLTTVLTEQNLSKEPTFIMLPAVMEWLYLQSPLASALFSGQSQSMLMTGDMGKLGGRGNYIVTNFVTGTGTQADPFCVFALTRQAVAFTQRLLYTRLWKLQNGHVSTQGLMIWGRGIIKDWALAEAWFYVDPSYAPSV